MNGEKLLIIKRNKGNVVLLSTVLDFGFDRILRGFEYNKKRIFIISSFCCLRNRVKFLKIKINDTKV